MPLGRVAVLMIALPVSNVMNNMSQTYIINQKFTFLEFLSITYFQVSRMKLIKRLFLFSAIAGLANALLNAFGVPHKNLIWYVFIVQFLSLPVFLILFLVVAGTLITILLMLLKPRLFTKTTLTFTHWGMEKKGEIINYSAPWSKFMKFTETKKNLFLYISDNEAHVVQKRMFEDNTQLENFKAFLSERISTK